MSSSTEDLVIVESTDYAQVVFDDVKDCYSHGRALECSFTLNELLKADSSDWIGIYKVGFTTCSDYVCHALVGLESTKEGKGKVVFQAESLPKEDVEFYQFVYVSQGKQIRGASLPFQFKQESAEFVEDDEQDAVVIKFEINETISEIKSRCEQLSKTNDTYEKLVKENEDMIKSLKDEVAAIKLRCFRLTMDNEKLNFTLRTKAENLKNLADTITSLTNENNKLQSKFDDVSNENKNLLESLQQRIDQIAQLKGELETVRINKGELENVLNLKESELLQLKKDKDELNRIAEDLQRINDQICTLEKQVDERVEELNKIKVDLKKNESIVAEQAQTIQNIVNERDALNGVIHKLTKEKDNLESNQDNMSQELTMSKDKLSAAEQCKEMLRAQLVAVTDELNEAGKKIDAHLCTIRGLNDKLAHSELENASLAEKLNMTQSDSEQKLDQINGMYHALRLAHTHLESRLKSSEQRRELSEKQNEIQKKTIEQLEQENDELKERIRAGAKEYTKLFEKYRLLRNQQFSNDMNVYHDLSSGDVHVARRNTTSHSQHENAASSANDSAIQDKTISQSARASSTDIENTLLDALLNSSLINNTTWNGNNTTRGDQSHKQSSQLCSSQQQTVLSATTTQPKSQGSDLSDDGLEHAYNHNAASAAIKKIMNQQQVRLNTQSQQMNRQGASMYQTIPDQDLPANYTCEICEYIFPTDTDQHDIEKHYTQHYGPSCPVCFLQFHKGYSQVDYENHVNNHFSN